MPTCGHQTVSCINPYELIRKYLCHSCMEVMMCACEEDFACRFLPHQLSTATELRTQRKMQVTLGFQPAICNTCRGLPEKAHPKAQRYGSTSKIVRYYWREIYFDQTQRFADWAVSEGYTDVSLARREHPDQYHHIEREVIEEIKKLHQTNPKYTYKEESQNEVLTKNQVEIVRLEATYAEKSTEKARILAGEHIFSVEEFAALHFQRQGYQVLLTESVPFHVIFGTFMWMLIQDITDPKVRVVGFGSRTAYDQSVRNDMRTLIRTHLPEDFGTSGYFSRRRTAIDEYFTRWLSVGKQELLWLFDYWTIHSAEFREYLWAHRSEDVKIARQIVSILPVDIIQRILSYLIGDYWNRYVGWPDLLVYNQEEFFFAEVKSSKDSLSEDQKNWIYGNTAELHLPFKIVKIHKKCG